MLKKTITYVDYLGTTRTEDYYFNLSSTELSDMQMSVDGGLKNMLDKMVRAKDNKEIYNTFVKIVLASYGEVSPDGKYFLKKDAEGHNLSDMFRQSLAYDAIMDEICQNETTIAEFCKGIIPKAAKEPVEPIDHQRPVELKDHQRPTRPVGFMERKSENQTVDEEDR